jgi:hypothetical protein
VREKSHIDDMRSAIRGDFERLAERRGGQELMREPQEQPPAHPPGEPEPPVTHETEQTESEELVTIRDEEPLELGQEFATDEPRVDELPETPPPAEDEPPRRSWLDRLLGR